MSRCRLNREWDRTKEDEPTFPSPACPTGAHTCPEGSWAIPYVPGQGQQLHGLGDQERRCGMWEQQEL